MPTRDSHEGDFTTKGRRFYVSHELRLRSARKEEPLSLFDPDGDEPGEHGVMVIAAVVVLAFLGLCLGLATGLFIGWRFF